MTVQKDGMKMAIYDDIMIRALKYKLHITDRNITFTYFTTGTCTRCTSP